MSNYLQLTNVPHNVSPIKITLSRNIDSCICGQFDSFYAKQDEASYTEMPIPALYEMNK